MMRLLIINPNTTDAMTRKIEAIGRASLPSTTRITAVSGRFGPRYISSRATFAIAAHAALDAYAEHGRDADGVLLACFGDPGLD
ncbi:MAG: Asp/Glu racemase, partial [Methylobacterium sp.]|nr:Asp/Glu racemase [Methylobacterium sp.]